MLPGNTISALRTVAPTAVNASFLGQVSGVMSGTYTVPSSRCMIVFCWGAQVSSSPFAGPSSVVISGHAATNIVSRSHPTDTSSIWAAMVDPGDPNTWSVTQASVFSDRMRLQIYKTDATLINATAVGISDAANPTATLDVMFAGSSYIGTTNAAGTGSNTWTLLSEDEDAVFSNHIWSSAHLNYAAPATAQAATCTIAGTTNSVGTFAVFAPRPMPSVNATYQTSGAASATSGTYTVPSSRSMVVLCWNSQASPPSNPTSVTISGHAATQCASNGAVSQHSSIWAAMVDPGDPDTWSLSQAIGLGTRAQGDIYTTDAVSINVAQQTSSTAVTPSATFDIPSGAAFIATAGAASATNGNTAWTLLTEDTDVAFANHIYTSAHKNYISATTAQTATATFSETTGSAGGAFAVFV